MSESEKKEEKEKKESKSPQWNRHTFSKVQQCCAHYWSFPSLEAFHGYTGNNTICTPVQITYHTLVRTL
jgi:hypothetical protein